MGDGGRGGIGREISYFPSQSCTFLFKMTVNIQRLLTCLRRLQGTAYSGAHHVLVFS